MLVDMRASLAKSTTAGDMSKTDSQTKDAELKEPYTIYTSV